MKLLTRPLIFTLGLSILLSMQSTTALAQPKVSVAGLQVIHVVAGEGANMVQPFNSGQVGTELALLVESEDGTIIEFDMDKSKLEGFIDNTKASLLKEGGGNFGRADGFGPFPRISKDGKRAILSVVGSSLPTKGASKIGAKGTLVAKIGKATEEIKSEPIDLVAGAEFSVGEVELSIKKVGPSQGGFGFQLGGDPKAKKAEGLFVSFQSGSAGMENVSKIQFLDEEGNELKASSAGSGKFGFGKKNTYTRDFNFEKKPEDKVIVSFSVWSDLEEVSIPFAVTTGLGTE